LIYFPPAKINLGLRVLDRRDDGFHNIESIFVPTQLCDILEVHKLLNEAEGELKFECSGLEVDGSIQNNTIVKAHQLLSNKFNLPAIEAKLHKVIPTGAGLGGGSSDGTFMLKAINEVCELGLSEELLEKYAEELGSDCPFFVKNRTSYVTGRGEKLTPISEAVDGLGLKHMMILIIHPNVHINTSEAFTWIKDKGVTEGLLSQSDRSNIDLTNQYIHDLLDSPVEKWSEILSNDFEIPVTSRFSAIKKALQLIVDSGADYIQMTGSGSSVYGLFELDNTYNTLKDTKRILKAQKSTEKASNEGFFVHLGALA
jgi:4-diphosphocytidyl-2-C-methyl-D-erythritol kinase